jgi:hypothetical protein
MLKADKIKLGIESAEAVEAARRNRQVTREDLLNFIQVHLAIGAIEVATFTDFVTSKQG